MYTHIQHNVMLIHTSLDYLESKGVNDPYKYFPREIDTQLTGSGMQLSDMVAKSTIWLDTRAEDYLKTKGVRLLKTPATSTKGQSFKSQPVLKGRVKNLPVYNPVEVINHFVKMEHERAMARYDIYIYMYTCLGYVYEYMYMCLGYWYECTYGCEYTYMCMYYLLFII